MRSVTWWAPPPTYTASSIIHGWRWVPRRIAGGLRTFISSKHVNLGEPMKSSTSCSVSPPDCGGPLLASRPLLLVSTNSPRSSWSTPPAAAHHQAGLAGPNRANRVQQGLAGRLSRALFGMSGAGVTLAKWQVGGWMGWWVGGLVGWWVGGWVGRWVGGWVGGRPGRHACWQAGRQASTLSSWSHGGPQLSYQLGTHGGA